MIIEDKINNSPTFLNPFSEFSRNEPYSKGKVTKIIASILDEENISKKMDMKLNVKNITNRNGTIHSLLFQFLVIFHKRK